MGTGRSIDVLLVDDHELVRQGVKAALSEPYKVVGDVGDGGTAIRLAPRLRPDVAVIDMRLPDMAGSDLCLHLRHALPNAHVIVLSGYEQEAAVQMAMHAGACHYVSKGSGISALRRSLDVITAQDDEGERHQHSTPCARPPEPAPLTTRTLTATEAQVLELAAQGHTDRQIGHQLFLAESTVRFHLQRLKTVLGAKSKTEAVAKAIRMGILPQVLDV